MNYERLSIEQKAQRYDEAIEKAKGVIEQNPLMEYLKKGIEYIFPELAESKDERIRKVLINVFATHKDYEMFFGVSVEDILAWLEKQDEHTNFRNKIQIGDKVTRNEDGVLVNLSQLNRVAKKKSEKKHTDNVEPKFKKGDIIKEKETGNLFYVNSVEEFGYTLHYKNCIAKGCTMDFKYEDNYELVEQKPAWSEEDETKLKSACALIRNTSLNGNKDVIDSTIAWLKSLKDRVHPQNKWKESLATADLENSLCDIQDGFSDTSYEYRILGEAIEFIRCTESKPYWKPSDEQMKALNEAIYHVDDSIATQIAMLIGDLKKLREEEL